MLRRIELIVQVPKTKASALFTLTGLPTSMHEMDLFGEKGTTVIATFECKTTGELCHTAAQVDTFVLCEIADCGSPLGVVPVGGVRTVPNGHEIANRLRAAAQTVAQPKGWASVDTSVVEPAMTLADVASNPDARD